MKHRRHPSFPSYRFYSDRRIMNKTTNRFINKVKEEANTKTYDELIREYNIPMGTIGYLLKKGRSSDNGNIVININRVIIRK